MSFNVLKDGTYNRVGINIAFYKNDVEWDKHVAVVNFDECPDEAVVLIGQDAADFYHKILTVIKDSCDKGS